MNNKGFMMAEVIVVSAIILVFMSSLYLSYGKLFRLYNTRISYYDSETLYGLVYYRDVLIKNDMMNATLDNTKIDKVTNLFTDDNGKVNKGDNIYIVYHAKDNLNRITGVNPTFAEYISYLSTSTTFKANYTMLMERCYDDKCTYAYLEVYDGYET